MSLGSIVGGALAKGDSVIQCQVFGQPGRALRIALAEGHSKRQPLARARAREKMGLAGCGLTQRYKRFPSVSGLMELCAQLNIVELGCRLQGRNDPGFKGHL